MTIEEAVVSALRGVEALGGRVYPVEAMRDAGAPFVFYWQIRDDEEIALDGPTGLMEAQFAVHVVAATYGELVTLCRSCSAALRGLMGEGYPPLLIGFADVAAASPDLKDQEVNYYRRALNLTVNYQVTGV